LGITIVPSPRNHGVAMPRQLPPDRLTAEKAIALLGISRWKFFELVKAGRIRRYREEPYVLGYYKRLEIEEYKRQLDAANAALREEAQ
jgi:hypothetical protein